MPPPINSIRLSATPTTNNFTPLGNQGVVFGPGNLNVRPAEIKNFLSNPNLTSDQILRQAQTSGVSLDQIRQSVPNDPRFSASNPDLMPFLAQHGITPPVPAAPTNVPQDFIPPPLGSQIPTGLRGSEQALQGGFEAAMESLLSGLSQNRADLTAGGSRANALTQQGVGSLQPFTRAGTGAIDLQAALSGASGGQRQAQAFSNFNSSPGQEFLRNRGERAILRNASAIGGLGSGRVRQALQREGIGFAQQDLDNQFARLSDVARSGLSAGQAQGSLFGQGANTAANLAQQQAQGSLSGGITAAQLGFDTGQSLSSGRTRVGEQLAGQLGETTSALANLVNQQGSGLSDLTGSTSGNLTQLLTAATQGQEAGQTQLAALLANLATGAGSNIAAVRPVQGILPTILDSAGKLASGLSGALGGGA